MVGVPESIGGVAGKLLRALGRVRGQRHPAFVGEDDEHVVYRRCLPAQAGQSRRETGVGVNIPPTRGFER